MHRKILFILLPVVTITILLFYFKHDITNTANKVFKGNRRIVASSQDNTRFDVYAMEKEEELEFRFFMISSNFDNVWSNSTFRQAALNYWEYQYNDYKKVAFEDLLFFGQLKNRYYSFSETQLKNVEMAKSFNYAGTEAYCLYFIKDIKPKYNFGNILLDTTIAFLISYIIFFLTKNYSLRKKG